MRHPWVLKLLRWVGAQVGGCLLGPYCPWLPEACLMVDVPDMLMECVMWPCPLTLRVGNRGQVVWHWFWGGWWH